MATEGRRLLDFVIGIHDPRVVGRTDHDLVAILVLALCGVRALHLVSVYATEVGVMLAQSRCEEKSNEITAIEALLPCLALKGAIVTIDAMGCQTAIVRTIVTQGGDYLLSVKDNQPKLHEAIQEYFAIAQAEDFRHLEPDVSQTLDKGHGRLETRRCTVLATPAYLEELARWKDVRALVKIEARREMGAQVETETRYAITSLAPNAGEILRAARLHWGIENGFHRCLDVAFREDASAIRLRNAAANFALLRRFALNLFRLDKRSKKSLPKKRKAAAWNSGYVVDLLNLRPLQEI